MDASTATFLPVRDSISLSLMHSGHSSERSLVRPFIPMISCLLRVCLNSKKKTDYGTAWKIVWSSTYGAKWTKEGLKRARIRSGISLPLFPQNPGDLGLWNKPRVKWSIESFISWFKGQKTAFIELLWRKIFPPIYFVSEHPAYLNSSVTKPRV